MTIKNIDIVHNIEKSYLGNQSVKFAQVAHAARMQQNTQSDKQQDTQISKTPQPQPTKTEKK